MQSLSRRRFLQAAAAAGLPQLRGAAGGGHPNLLFIIADQHSGLALGAAG
ncbi:MAG: twin-arginine translocation signal domain-containing protein, partial [Bryobacterales bacterium]|nr:twin-arginine translocation signal domain-containing protein [Bryobacterales bacterium]